MFSLFVLVCNAHERMFHLSLDLTPFYACVHLHTYTFARKFWQKKQKIFQLKKTVLEDEQDVDLYIQFKKSHMQIHLAKTLGFGY